MSTVFANHRSILHKGDGFTQVCPLPDTCKTPTPGGPAPVPYPNAAQDSDLSGGSKRVRIEGNPVALSDSCLSTSTGDEAGTAGGGIVSGKIKGKCTFTSSSPDVVVEGKSVVRFLDICLHNGNSSNTGSEPAVGDPGGGLPDEHDETCPSPTHASESVDTASDEVKDFLRRKVPEPYWNRTLGADGGGGFLRGQAAITTLPKGTQLIRYWGGAAPQMGCWWSRFPALSPISELALPPGCPGSQQVIGTLKEDTEVIIGPGAPRCTNKPGGTEQIYIPYPAGNHVEVTP